MLQTETTALKIPCPACGTVLRVPGQWLGRTMRCRACSKAVLLRGRPGAAEGGLPAPLVEAIPGEYPASPVSAAAPNRYKPRRPDNSAAWILTSVLVLATGFIGVLVVKPELITGKLKTATAADGEKPAPEVVKGVAPAAELLASSGTFPRRLLVVNVSNYIYANPTHNGEGQYRKEIERRDIVAFANRLSEKWKIPKDQVYELSDTAGPKAKAATLPLKEIVLKTVDLFLNSSRAQDRIALVFCGHAVEKDGAVYLATMESDLEEPATMIPLADLYAKLKGCPAQEKLAVFDVCRKNSKLGEERPTAGAMTEAMEKAFLAPPPGVSAWTACAANQFSYELNGEQYGEDFSTNVNGSIFLNLFFAADYKGKLAVREGGKGGLQVPDDPLPLTALEAFVREQANVAAKAMEQQPQTPKFARAAPAVAVAFNAAEPSPPHFALPKPKATASAREVAAIFAEMSLPPIKKGTNGTKGLEGVIPFDAAVLKEYRPDGVPPAEEADAAKHPLRAAVLDAQKQIRDYAAMQTKELPTELREAVNDNLKKRLTNLQRPLADAEALFRELRTKFAKAAKAREEEKSKRWLAHFDYMSAQIDLRLAYFGEYNKALSLVKTDNLDTAGAKNGFILGFDPKMSAAKEIREVADEGKTILEQMAKDYAGTPWGVLAKRDKSMSLGLKWFPVKLPGEEAN